MSDCPPICQFDAVALDLMMPMSVLILPTGHIGRVGATIAKLRPDQELTGKRFLEIFQVKRPRKTIINYAGLKAIVGVKMRLQFRIGVPILMKGVIIQECGSNCLLVNLSFGFNLIEAVGNYGLTNGDFSETELAIEMLYLIEAKNAVMEETRNLNERLSSARLAAVEQALSDALTGLRNRRAMDQSLLQLSKSGMPFGLMNIDLDFFKAVNDTLGHAAGDHVLQATATILINETRKQDTVARVGGDEFVVIFNGLVDKNRLLKIGNRIIKSLEKPVIFEDQTCRISASIGITTSDFYSVLDLDQMLSDADVALYASKRKGRACTTMISEKLLADAGKSEADLPKPALVKPKSKKPAKQRAR